MRKKNCCNSTIWRKLNSTLKALFVELVGKRLNRALAFASTSTNICNLVVDILPCSERTALPYECLNLFWSKASGREVCKLRCTSRELSVDWMSRGMLARLVVVDGKALIRTVLESPVTVGCLFCNYRKGAIRPSGCCSSLTL